jgi:hypothetical protein
MDFLAELWRFTRVRKKPPRRRNASPDVPSVPAETVRCPKFLAGF